MTKRKANHVINGMNAAKSQGNGAGYIEDDQLVLTEEQRQNNKKRKKINKKGASIMTNKNTGKDIRQNSPKEHQSGQPEPLSGSKKVKNRNHTRQKHNSHHDM